MSTMKELSDKIDQLVEAERWTLALCALGCSLTVHLARVADKELRKSMAEGLIEQIRECIAEFEQLKHGSEH